MKRSMISKVSILFAAACSVFSTGCSLLDARVETPERAKKSRVEIEKEPFRSITDFSGALRCMDDMMITYGVRDLSILVDDIYDATKEINAGTRDMLISALSDMTQRSRGLNVIAPGWGYRGELPITPTYVLAGSVSQNDKNVSRSQTDLAVWFRRVLTLGSASDSSVSILALDLRVLRASDQSVLSGVTSRNSVAIVRRGQGLDGEAGYSKFGVNFSLALTKSDGQGQALRRLVELAAVELVGKLSKIPYWKCVRSSEEKKGEKLNQEVELEIRREISVWYDAMTASRVELIAYFQNQMQQRGLYSGPIDGQFNPELDQAIETYREALGLTRRALLDREFFSAYLGADHSTIVLSRASPKAL